MNLILDQVVQSPQGKFRSYTGDGSPLQCLLIDDHTTVRILLHQQPLLTEDLRALTGKRLPHTYEGNKYLYQAWHWAIRRRIFPRRVSFLHEIHYYAPEVIFYNERGYFRIIRTSERRYPLRIIPHRSHETLTSLRKGVTLAQQFLAQVINLGEEYSPQLQVSASVRLYLQYYLHPGQGDVDPQNDDHKFCHCLSVDFGGERETEDSILGSEVVTAAFPDLVHASCAQYSFQSLQRYTSQRLYFDLEHGSSQEYLDRLAAVVVYNFLSETKRREFQQQFTFLTELEHLQYLYNLSERRAIS